MKVGDLVNFWTRAWVFKHAERRYANPGVILEEIRVHDGTSTGLRYQIMWSDQKITTEYPSYLQLVEVPSV